MFFLLFFVQGKMTIVLSSAPTFTIRFSPSTVTVLTSADTVRVRSSGVTRDALTLVAVMVTDSIMSSEIPAPARASATTAREII